MFSIMNEQKKRQLCSFKKTELILYSYLKEMCFPLVLPCL